MPRTELRPPSPFFLRHRERLRELARCGPVVDLACGPGRHALAAAEVGARVIALDRSPDSLHVLEREARARGLPVLAVRTDLERGWGIPLREGSAAAVLVFRYLFRPLVRAIASLLAPGGLLLYETFTIHQRELGYGPKNKAFLLRDGELVKLFPGLETLEYEEGISGDPPAALARLAARRPPSEPRDAPTPRRRAP